MTADQILSFEKTFEFTLLSQYIKEQYPHVAIKEIENAINKCMQVTKPPRTEDEFVKCVKTRLMVG
jgi:hypothetical protein